MLPITRIQFKLRSDIGLIVHHARRELHDEREIRALVRKLKKFNPKTIGRLNTRYLKKKKPNVGKFNREIRELINEFLVYYSEYRKYFRDIIKLFNEANIAAQSQQAVTIEEVGSMIDDIIRTRRLPFTEDAKKQFKKEYLEYILRMRRMIVRSKKSDIRLLHMRAPKTKFIRRFFPEKTLTREERKEAFKVGSRYLSMKETEARIQEELVHGVRQDFLLLLLRYLRGLEEVDAAIGVIQEDIKLLVAKQADEYRKVTKNLTPFIKLVKEHPELKRRRIVPEQIEEDIKKLNSLIADFASNDWKDENYIKRLCKLLEAKGRALEAAIEVVK